MPKNKQEFNTEPLTPTQRAEVLLKKAEHQFEKLSYGLLDHIGPVEEVTMDYYLICDTNPHSPKAPVLVDGGKLGGLVDRYGAWALQPLSIKRNAIGQCDFSIRLNPIKVDTYVQEINSGNFALSTPDTNLSNQAEGPTINGYPVEHVHGMDGSGSNMVDTLTRLEWSMGQIEDAAVVRPQTHYAV